MIQDAGPMAGVGGASSPYVELEVGLSGSRIRSWFHVIVVVEASAHFILMC
jgi:hypothetical protein